VRAAPDRDPGFARDATPKCGEACAGHSPERSEETLLLPAAAARGNSAHLQPHTSRATQRASPPAPSPWHRRRRLGAVSLEGARAHQAIVLHAESCSMGVVLRAPGPCPYGTGDLRGMALTAVAPGKCTSGSWRRRRGALP
jgi:cell wall-associated NlpC family hydrolase